MCRELVNVDKLESAFKKYTERGSVNLDSLLDKWEKNKSSIVELFKGKLRIDKEYSVVMPNNDYFTRKINNFIDDNYNYGGGCLSSIASEVMKYHIGYTDYIENAGNNLRSYRLPDEAANIFKQGMKISSFLRQLIPDDQEWKILNGKWKSRREIFDIEYSKLVQSFRSKGIITISVDPIDYLTMSVNDSGWRSCHHAYNGEYRGGCLSYMMDDSSIVAYVHNGSEADYGEFSHNSKNWRQMLYISPKDGLCVFSRQYPREDNYAVNELYEIIGGLFAEQLDVEKKWKIETSCGGYEDEILGNIEDDGLHYGDLHSGYGGSRLIMTSCCKPNDVTIYVGDDNPPCPICSKGAVNDREELTCQPCINRCHCNGCGSRVSLENALSAEGSNWCEECYNNRFMNCYHCDTLVRRNDTYRIEDGDRVCLSCARDHYSECRHCSDYVEACSENMINGSYVCSDCTSEYYTDCNECGATTRNRNLEDGLCPYCYEERCEEEEELERRGA